MANNHHRYCRRRGCMNMACGRWENYPYYNGPCAGTEGTYRCDCNENEQDNRDCGERDRCGRCDRRCRRRWCGNCCAAMFLAYQPMAIAANGIVPLVANNPCRNSDFDVNSGLITLEEQGVYLATYTVRVPEGATLDTTLTLNVDDASQSSAITQIASGGTGTSAYSGQAIFEADEGATVALRSSDAISVTDSAIQPMFTLSLVRLDG